MKANNVTTEKSIADNKQNVIEQRKEQLKSTSKKSILDLDLNNLDNDNILDLLNKSNFVKESKISTKKQMFKFERETLSDTETKRRRTKIRKQRNKLCDNILFLFQNQKEKELKEEIKKFNEFYLKEYILNDFSLSSMCNENSDKDTKEKLTIMLAIIQRQK